MLYTRSTGKRHALVDDDGITRTRFEKHISMVIRISEQRANSAEVGLEIDNGCIFYLEIVLQFCSVLGKRNSLRQRGADNLYKNMFCV